MRRGLYSAIVAVAILAVGPATIATGLSTFEGVMSFPTITGPADPEEYSWEVVLAEDQELKLVDPHHAVVYYNGDNEHPAAMIVATDSHDANGASVPTTLGVSDGNVLTLTVHHRAGNTEAGGAPFDYPIVAGPGWDGGFTTTIVQGPPAEGTSAPAEPQPTVAAQCLVPQLKGSTLPAVKRRLRRAGCRLGAVKRQRPRLTSSRVVRQGQRPGKALAQGAPVDVTLGARGQDPR